MGRRVGDLTVVADRHNWDTGHHPRIVRAMVVAPLGTVVLMTCPNASRPPTMNFGICIAR
jgi:hypothetical protein